MRLCLAKLDKDKEAFFKYSANWDKVNLDEFIETLTVTDDEYNIAFNKRKISFFDDGKEYEIVCAVGASYFRILRKGYIDQYGNKHGDVYVGKDLKEPKISAEFKGKTAKEERNRLTHFRMTYKKGTK